MIDSMEESRATLRQYLIRRPLRSGSGDPDSFPRSSLMRTLFDPDKRGLWLAAASLSTMVFPHLVHVGTAGRLVSKYKHLGRFISRLRA